MSRDWLLCLPDHVLTTHVFTYFSFRDYALVSCGARYLCVHWVATNQREPWPLHVPEDANLEEAVSLVALDKRIDTIVIGQGHHRVTSNYLKVATSVRLVGRQNVPRKKIVIVGGIWIKPRERINGNVHLEHLTVRSAKFHGVFSQSPFTMEDVLVEKCGGDGVCAYSLSYVSNPVVGRCTNVEVRHCHESGVCACHGAKLLLMGEHTKVHDNCTNGYEGHGLEVYNVGSDGNPSRVQLVSPLTKETVSFDNSGNFNWGSSYAATVSEIKTIKI